MKNTLSFALKTFGFWLLIGWLCRLLFLIFTWRSGSSPQITSILNAYAAGFRLDASMAGYLTLLHSAIRAICFAAPRMWKPIFRVVQITVLICFGILVASDALMYKYWASKIDMTAFAFLLYPKEALASGTWKDVSLFVLVLAIFLSTSLFLSKWFYRKTLKPVPGVLPLIASLLVMGAMIIPIRGGLGVSTLNLSSAYFSSTQYLNHLAINTPWNASFSVLNQDKIDIPENEENLTASYKIFNNLYNGTSNSTVVFPDSTHVVLIVLESFTAGVVESLGGEPGLTPNLDYWASKGWQFKNFYSNGDRSHYGLTSLITGLPAIPQTSVLKFPDKLENLPNLFKKFNQEGYRTNFMYGGNSEFSNIKALFNVEDNGGILDEKILMTRNPKQFGKWGIHDEHTFKWLLEECTRSDGKPHLTILYTLSSHEPFDVPSEVKNGGRYRKLFHAVQYVDSCLGDFLNQLSASPDWKNTLVVITADHGIRQPGDYSISAPEKYHIPLVFTGGVIDTPKIFTHASSHTDLPMSIEQSILGHYDSRYQFSKNVFDTSNSFANYYYNVGSGFIQDSNFLVHDYILGKTLSTNLKDKKTREHFSEITQAYTDVMLHSFRNLNKKRSPALKEQGK